MPLLNDNQENRFKRKKLINPDDQRYLEAGQTEISERLSRSTLFRPEQYVQDITEEDYMRIGRERLGKEEGGIFKRGISAIGGGLLGAGEMYGRAIRALPGGEEVGVGKEGVSGAILRTVKGIEERFPILKERPPEGEIGRSIYGGIRSAVTSLTARAPYMAAGAAIGTATPLGPVGTFLGALGGYIVGGATLFGLAEYDRALEETYNSEQFKRGKITQEQAEGYALKSGIFEFGGEAVSDVLTAWMLGAGTIVGQPAKQAIKSWVTGLFKSSGKETAKRVLGIAAGETLGELATAGLQTEAANKINLTDRRFLDGVKEAFGPAFVASLIFGGLGEGGIRITQARMKNALNNPKVTPEERFAAAKYVSDQIRTGSPDVANIWDEVTTEAINNGESITDNEKVIDEFSKNYETRQEEKSRDVAASKTISDLIDEGMTTGQILNEPFTPEVALSVIKEAYAGKALTDENIDQFKEKYPELRTGLNDIIGENLKVKIDQEVQNAERVRRISEEASIKERVEREKKAGLHLRVAEKDRLEAEKRIREKALMPEERQAIIEAETPEQIAKQAGTTYKGVSEGLYYWDVDVGLDAPTTITTRNLNAEELQKKVSATQKLFAEKEVAPEKAVKEAWEMTREEYQTDIRGKSEIQAAFKAGDEVIPAGAIHDWNVLTKEQRSVAEKKGLTSGYIDKDGKFFTDKTSPLSRGYHHGIIKQAISEGKPVPESVLAEYPDLAPAKKAAKEPWDRTQEDLAKLSDVQLIAEVKAIPKTHAIGLGAGQQEFTGTFLSTEKGGNRYAANKGIEIVEAKPEIENPKIFRSAIKYASFREKFLDKNIDEATMPEIQEAGKKATEYLQKQGYDSVYLPEADINEGILVVFDRKKAGVLTKPQPKPTPTEAKPGAATAEFEDKGILTPTLLKEPPENFPYREVIVDVSKEDVLAELEEKLSQLITQLPKENLLNAGLTRQEIKIIKDNIKKVKSTAGKTIKTRRYQVVDKGLKKPDLKPAPKEAKAEVAEKAEAKKTKEVKTFNDQLKKATKLHKDSYGLNPKNSLQRLLEAKQILNEIGYPKNNELYVENDRLIENYKEQLGIKEEAKIAEKPAKPKEYPLIKNNEVDGRTVLTDVPNTDSIEATLMDYDVLSGIREVPMEAIAVTAPNDLFYAADDMRNVKALAQKIKDNKEISPLIVVQDKDGLYVLEGVHRLGALHEIGAKSFPAMVVRDLESLKAKSAEKPVGEVPKFATKATKPQDTITRKDLKEMFSGMKNIATGQDKDGNFYFQHFGKPKVIIYEVNHIDGYMDTSSGRIPVGSYLKDTIQLKTGGVGPTAGVSEGWHEFYHHLIKIGVVSNNDIQALNRAIGKAETTEDDQAYYIGDRLAEWQSQKNFRIKRILKKIADFMNAVWEFVSRTRTARGVLSDIESGKILSEKEVSGINQFAQDVSFSLKKAVANIRDNPKFVKWFGKSKVVDENGKPLVVYHGGDTNIRDFSRGSNRGDMGIAYFTDDLVVAQKYAILGGVRDEETGTSSVSGYRKKLKESGLKRTPKVTKVYLSIKNPASIDTIMGQDLIDTYGKDTVKGWVSDDTSLMEMEELQYGGYEPSKLSEKGYKSIDEYLEDNLAEYIDDEYSKQIENIGYDYQSLGGNQSSGFTLLSLKSMLPDFLKRNGYDGWIYDDFETNKKTYVPISPTQIKSIFNTEFDPTNPDIRYAQTAERFYSQVIKTVETKMPAKMQASAVINWLKKQPGVKPAELEWMGIEEMLEGKKIIGKDDLVQLLRQNEVRVEEVTKADIVQREPIETAARERFEDEFDLNEYLGGVSYKRVEAQIAWNDSTHRIWESTGETKENYDNYEDFEDTVTQLDAEDIFTDEVIADMTEDAWADSATTYKDAEEERRAGIEEGTQFSRYQLPGEKENYRELLFTLPTPPQTNAEMAQEMFGKKWSELSGSEMNTIIQKSADDSVSGRGIFRSGHWDEPNVFAHVRINERIDADGAKILFVEEVQSDQNLSYRKQLTNIEESVTNDFKTIVKNMTKTGVLKEVC